MKHYTLTLLVFCMFAGIKTFSQSVPPQGISYQAVAREADGDELVNVSISVKIGIVSGSINGSIEWEETHNVVTDQFGLFSLVIGQGAPTGVGIAATFGEVDWAAAAHFLRVEIDSPSAGGFELMGTSELLSVPYALYAENSGNSFEADGDITNELITDMYSSGGTLFVEEAGIVHELDLNTLITDNDPANESVTEMEYIASNNQLLLTESGTPYSSDLSDLEDGDWHESVDLTSVSNTTQMVGIGTPTPNSTLHVNGSYSAAVTTLTGPLLGYIVSDQQQVLLCNTTASMVNMIFPPAAGCNGRIYTVKRYDTEGFAGNTVTIDTSDGDLIELQSSFTMNWLLTETASFISDGDNWWLLHLYQEQP